MRMLKVLVICPYNLSILKAISNVLTVKLADITIIGNKKRIMELCYIYGITNRFFEVISADNEIDICFAANEQLKQSDFDLVIFGYLSKDFHKNIAIADIEVKVIDIPKIRHLLFAPINTKDTFISFDDKIAAIIKAKEVMELLKIKHYNIGLIDNYESKTALIERNIIRMHPQLNNDAIDIIGIREVYEDAYNILIFNSRNSLNIFLDTIVIDHNVKHASIKKASDFFIIDAFDMNSKDIFFSIFLISKISLNSEAC